MSQSKGVGCSKLVAVKPALTPALPSRDFCYFVLPPVFPGKGLE